MRNRRTQPNRPSSYSRETRWNMNLRSKFKTFCNPILVKQQKIFLREANSCSTSTSKPDPQRADQKQEAASQTLYALYVLIEDYLSHRFDEKGNYSNYQGAAFTDLFKRQRELPFGSRLQNHALNHRMNSDFRKYFPQIEYIPILRDVETKRYWINGNLLKISVVGDSYNIAKSIIQYRRSLYRSKAECI